MLDELIDRYGDPPDSVVGLVDTALLRNTAAQLGITEIKQKRGMLLFYVEHPEPEQITALSAAYKGRIEFNSLAKPYIGVKAVKGDKTMKLMEDVLFAMWDAKPPQPPEN
ncbi:transcription-repair coupling factor [Ruminococcus sp. CAG:379]|nr:transcription-repair coupling factor [Ruminococcus sp. CAG:379]